mmetsp:Transcript_5254/g.7588  ORF Transcript_5254/g.7588 Transcript_5254/m.7588 type:complete len:1153 (-) Transcript_5254:227-3685(-)|eukprot:CAMPEP_0194219738 /NCGR_PEP_ID=MMETSP0156-20130528/26740_1 /TAXON_ID=33649 /ORGANISM="Thalassionema nitzschioides, Strain L26-B" /LENGTH=1152 /DNA_ID=CAMNT_0038949525 /DNA_START=92 /DNA_END=3550 /DNA_ORIENTATION=+
MKSNHRYLESNSSSLSDRAKNVFTPAECLSSENPEKLPSPNWEKGPPSSSSGTASMSSWSKTSTPVRNSSRTIKDFPTKLKMDVGRRPEQNFLIDESKALKKEDISGMNFPSRSQKNETNSNEKVNEFQTINAAFQERSIPFRCDEVTKGMNSSTLKSGATWRAKFEGVKTKVVVADSSWIDNKSRKHISRNTMGSRDASIQPLTNRIVKERGGGMNLDPSSAPTEVRMNLSSSFKESNDSSDFADAATEINENPSCTKNITKSNHRKSPEQKEQITANGNTEEMNQNNGVPSSPPGRLQRLVETTSSASMKNDDGSIQSIATSVGVETGVGVAELPTAGMVAKALGVSTSGETSQCMYKGSNYKVKKVEGYGGTVICSERQSKIVAMLTAGVSREKLGNVTEQKSLTGIIPSAPSISTPLDSSYSGLEQEYYRRGLEQSKKQIQHLYSPDRVLENAFPDSLGNFATTENHDAAWFEGDDITSISIAQHGDGGNNNLKSSVTREKSMLNNSERNWVPRSKSPGVENRELPEAEGKSAGSASGLVERYLSAINSCTNATTKSENICLTKGVHRLNSEKGGDTVFNNCSKTSIMLDKEERSKKVLSSEVSRTRCIYEQGQKKNRDDDSSVDVKSACSIFEESTMSSNGKTSGDKSSFESVRFLFEKETRQGAKTRSIREKFETRSMPQRLKLATKPGKSTRKKDVSLTNVCNEEPALNKNLVFVSEEISDASCIDVKKATDGELKSSDSSRVIQLDHGKISKNETIQNCEQYDPYNSHGDYNISLSVQDRIKSFSPRIDSTEQTINHKKPKKIDKLTRKDTSLQISQQKSPSSVLNENFEKNERADRDGYEDGVTLDLSISDVSGLTTPTCIRSKEELSTISRQSSDLRVFSEASSSQTSEAATPLLAMSLHSRYFNSSDDCGYFAHRSFGERLTPANHSKWTPITTPINEKRVDTEKVEDCTWLFGNAESDPGQVQKENADDDSVWQASWGSLDESGWQSFETWNIEVQSKSLDVNHGDQIQRAEIGEERNSRLQEIKNESISRAELKHKNSFENALVTRSDPTIEDEKEFKSKSNTVSSVFMSKLQLLREARIRRNSAFLKSKFSKNRNQAHSGSPFAGSTTSCKSGEHSASHSEASTYFGGDHFSKCLEID